MAEFSITPSNTCFHSTQYLDSNLNILTKFIAACSSPSSASLGIRHARQVFDQIPQRNDSFLCNVTIKSHIDNHQFTDALILFRDLRRMTQFVPDNYTYLFMTKSCGSDLYNWEGRQLHSHVIRTGFGLDLFVSTSIVDMYGKMCDMVSARKVFDEMSVRNAVSWTAMVCGFARVEDIDNAWKYFDEMPGKDVSAYNAIIGAFVKVGDMNSARSLFNAMPERNVISWTSMISGFCENDDIESARLFFDSMPRKSLVSWNAMISGYCQNKQPREAVKLFRELQLNAVLEADEVTIISILPAVAELGALDFGCWVHQYVKRKRLDKSIKICTSLIDMYAKCGDIDKARRVFEEIPEKATSCWNAIINGLAVNGKGREAVDEFENMIYRGYTPNAITMIGVLSACSHSGLVEEGKKWLNAMESFGLAPTIEHYGCVIDLLCRIGSLEEAEKLLESMPYEANEVVISSFLSGCVNRKDLPKAVRILKRAVKKNLLNAGNYILLRNLYAMERKWIDMRELKGYMRTIGVKKEAGCSAIEADGMVCEFMSGSIMHPHQENILPVLKQLQMHMKKINDENMLESCIAEVSLQT
ncbi:pentatricopeptide repeat-containing protein At2g44880-like [Chenopodium quinoa]|uniref:pentatricopeptide repeat-containing protein At2g44880-like n=1 Tax=Chenopodium quinoa TaxID=63459 RepID=UPI000B786924|nr:pentatricopeptide repeat-containing protein At2g44880-like [Chenopodium quinoa]